MISKQIIFHDCSLSSSLTNMIFLGDRATMPASCTCDLIKPFILPLLINPYSFIYLNFRNHPVKQIWMIMLNTEYLLSSGEQFTATIFLSGMCLPESSVKSWYHMHIQIYIFGNAPNCSIEDPYRYTWCFPRLTPFYPANKYMKYEFTATDLPLFGV